ncbi:MAG: hypothetical protein SOY07_08960 [Bacteroidales bacterium]|nr:hypothetical protein [Bacteroidales bacterium]
MFYSIPIDNEEIVTSTPKEARAITHLYFEKKNEGLHTYKKDLDRVSIFVDGRQIAKNLPVMPFCTSVPYGTDRHEWQKTALEININVDFSEVKISAGNINDYNVVFVCSEKECDESKGCEFVEMQEIELLSNPHKAIEDGFAATKDDKKTEARNILLGKWNSLSESKTNIANLKKAITAAKGDIDKEQKNLEEKQGKLTSTTEELNAKQEELTKTTEELNAKNKLLGDKNDELTKAEDELKALKDSQSKEEGEQTTTEDGQQTTEDGQPKEEGEQTTTEDGQPKEEGEQPTEDIESKIERLKGEIVTLQGEIDGLKATQNTLQGEIDGLKTTIATLTENINNWQTAKSNVENNETYKELTAYFVDFNGEGYQDEQALLNALVNKYGKDVAIVVNGKGNEAFTYYPLTATEEDDQKFMDFLTKQEVMKIDLRGERTITLEHELEGLAFYPISSQSVDFATFPFELSGIPLSFTLQCGDYETLPTSMDTMPLSVSKKIGYRDALYLFGEPLGKHVSINITSKSLSNDILKEASILKLLVLLQYRRFV